MATKKEKDARRKSLRPHPARDKIIDAMRSYGQPISPSQLSGITGATLGSTAYHVRTLVAAGLLELADEARVRGAVEHFYALVPGDEEQTQLVDPIHTLLGLCGALTVPGRDGGYPRPSVVDDEARAELDEILQALQTKVQQIVVASTARAPDS